MEIACLRAITMCAFLLNQNSKKKRMWSALWNFKKLSIAMVVFVPTTTAQICISVEI